MNTSSTVFSQLIDFLPVKQFRKCVALSVVNLNDDPYDEAQLARLLDLCPGGRPTVALLPYSGAGPYPQTYEFERNDTLALAVREKRERTLGTFERFVDRLRPQRAIPFAGQYWLGGPLSVLNADRGVPDATEAAARRPEVGLVLADGGGATLDLRTLEASATRTRPYDGAAVQAHLDEVFPGHYDYELEIQPFAGHALPTIPLSRVAYAHALARQTIDEPWFVCIRPGGREEYIVLDVSGEAGWSIRRKVEDLERRFEIFIDERYLFGLLARMYHWNNADIGSHFRVRRTPNVLRREISNFLSNLHV